jgi:hypothetical protein
MRARPPIPQPVKIIPQVRPTSQAILYWKPSLVKLLVHKEHQVVLRQDGQPMKRQPKPWKPGDKVYARLGADGLISLMPFELAGQGYEIILDAEEGVHYGFIS